MSDRLLVLGWHNVSPTPFFAARAGDGLKGLTAQLRALQAAATVVDLADAVDRLQHGERLPPRSVAVTFDDGYRDNVELAVPLLERLGMPATFFLCPDLLSGHVSPWWERLAWATAGARRSSPLRWEGVDVVSAGRVRPGALDELCERLKTLDEAGRAAALERLVELLDPAGPEPPGLMMDWDDARRLVGRGFAVGSHSLRHTILANELGDAQRRDLRRSRQTLAAELGCPVSLLAYPNGRWQDFDTLTVAAAAAAGYRGAVTTVDGWNHSHTSPMALRRFVVYPERGVVGLGVLARHALRVARSSVMPGRWATATGAPPGVEPAGAEAPGAGARGEGR